MNQWLLTADDQKESEAREFSSGAYRPGESDDAAPHYLVEADDLYDEEYGESRLVAPPVLGEAPPSFRDF